MPDLEGPARRIRDAIAIPGRQPALHHRILTRHRREWPALWAAIDDLLNALGPDEGGGSSVRRGRPRPPGPAPSDRVMLPSIRERTR